jgi:aspartyl-tRNA(Asn)/glutamyl-tRNA(Gln) amidotransferase subunit A
LDRNLMTDIELAQLNLTEVAAGIAAKRYSSVEVTRNCLDRLAGIGERLTCVAGIDAEVALTDAKIADADLASGRLRGPLHGVPLGHKDMFFRAGRLTACGSRILAEFVPDHTATVLTRLDAAGALDIARLNMVEFATGGSVFGHNPITGTPKNPWNPAYVTGGSSSGSGAAVAARVVYGALASDTGGSLRIPASCCGLVGIKPTYGRVSRYGAMPLAFSLDHPGVVTRTVGDCALLLGLVAGHDPNDPRSSTRSVPDYSASIEDDVGGLRIGVPNNYFYDYLDGDIRTILDVSIAEYRTAGAVIVPVDIPPSFAQASSLNSLIFHVEAGRVHSKWLRDCPDKYGPRTSDRFVAGLHFPATRYIEALELRTGLLADFVEMVFDKVDILHAPVVPVPLPTIEDSDPAHLPDYGDYSARISHCTRPLNFLGLPTLSMPAGFDGNGLPVGFQLIGRPFDEALLFRAGRVYERETDWTIAAPTL